MARYNTVLQSVAASTTINLATPTQGLFTELTGSGYTVTIANPVSYSGYSQTFYNAGSGAITLSTPSGSFVGPGASSASTMSLPVSSRLTIFSDGTNWVSAFDGNGPLVASTLNATGAVTLSPSGATVTLSPSTAAVTISPTGAGGNVVIQPAGTVTINPTTASTIDNTAIGSTTRAAGAFTTLAANNTVSMTLGTDATAYNSGGTLTVTGGVGISGKLFTNNNITSAGILSLSASSGTHTISSSTGSSSTATGALTVSGGLGVGGTIYAVGLVETSSLAFKENINPLNNALESILQLVGVSYDRKDTKKHEIGLIAEHVYDVIPDVVTLDENGNPYGIHYTKLSAYLIEAVKALQNEIDDLKGSKVKSKGKK